MPTVSVIIPCYNYSAYVEECVRSVLEQTYTDFEVIVIDDGSTDGSAEIISQFNDPRLVFVRFQTNQGHIKALSEGFKRARGMFVAMMGADDKWDKNFLAKCVPILEANPRIGVVHTNFQLMQSDGSLSKDDMRPASLSNGLCGSEVAHLLMANYLTSNSGLMRREALNDLNPLFSEDIPYAEDWRLWLHIGKSYDFYYFDSALAFYRVHTRNFHSQPKAYPLGEKCGQAILREFFQSLDGKSPFHRLKAKALRTHFLRYADLYYSVDRKKDSVRCLGLAAKEDPWTLFKYAAWKRLLLSLVPSAVSRTITRYRLASQMALFCLPLFVGLFLMEAILWRVPNSYSKMYRAAQGAPSAEILILGDSHSLLLENSLSPIPVLNLSSVSESLTVEKQLFEKYFDGMPKLKLVVLNLSYFSLDFRLTESPESWREYFLFRYFGVMGDRNADALLDLRNYSLFLDYGSASATQYLLEFAKGKTNFSVRQDLGSGALGPTSEVSLQDGAERIGLHHRIMQPQFRSRNLASLRSIVQACYLRNIPVALVNLPVHHNYYEKMRPEVTALIRQVENDLKTEFPKTVNLGNWFESPSFTDADFTNSDHLSPSGRAKAARMLLKTFWRSPSKPEPNLIREIARDREEPK